MTAPVFPTAADAKAAQQQLRQLKDTRLPKHLTQALEAVLTPLASGKGVQITTVKPHITTQQAAELLHVSRPYLVKLLDAGQIPHHKVGPRRRLHLEDVLDYKQRLDTQRQQALNALANDLQDMGLD